LRDIPQGQIHKCYKTTASTNIIIGSSSSLSDNIISEFPLIRIDVENNPKLDYRYSVLVRQYALTKDAFEFWRIMQKNTQNLGTLFDPLPSQLKSNLHCLSDPEEQVIGYVSAGEYTQKRIFISKEDLPIEFLYNRYPGCIIDTVNNDPASLDLILKTGNYQPIVSVGAYTPTGYLYSTLNCVDCRTGGGSAYKPDFWE
jgi:hypothetical protein